MDAFNRPVMPPAPRVLAEDLSTWRFILEFSRNTLGIWSQSAFEKRFIRGRTLGIESVLLNDPDGARQVFTTHAERYGRPIPFLRVTRPLAGSGVLLAEGEDWRRQRRMLAPMFNPGSVGLLLPHFIDAGRAMVRRLDAARAANLSAAFHDAALDAVLRALFSLPVT